MGRQLKCVQWQLERIGAFLYCYCTVNSVWVKAKSDPWTFIMGIVSDPIIANITLHENNLSRHEHNGMITHSCYEGTMRTKMNKKKGWQRQRIQNTSHSLNPFIKRFSDALSSFKSGISSRRDLRAAGSVKWITSQCEKQCMDEPRERWESCGRVETKQGRGH